MGSMHGTLAGDGTYQFSQSAGPPAAVNKRRCRLFWCWRTVIGLGEGRQGQGFSPCWRAEVRM